MKINERLNICSFNNSQSTLEFFTAHLGKMKHKAFWLICCEIGCFDHSSCSFFSCARFHIQQALSEGVITFTREAVFSKKNKKTISYSLELIIELLESDNFSPRIERTLEESYSWSATEFSRRRIYFCIIFLIPWISLSADFWCEYVAF